MLGGKKRQLKYPGAAGYSGGAWFRMTPRLDFRSGYTVGTAVPALLGPRPSAIQIAQKMYDFLGGDEFRLIAPAVAAAGGRHFALAVGLTTRQRPHHRRSSDHDQAPHNSRVTSSFLGGDDVWRVASAMAVAGVSITALLAAGPADSGSLGALLLPGGGDVSGVCVAGFLPWWHHPMAVPPRRRHSG